MESPRGHGPMGLQDANWERFCRYHIGDWYGLWTPYTVDGGALTPRPGIRRFRPTAGGRAIPHPNPHPSRDGGAAAAGRSPPTGVPPPRNLLRGAGSRRWARTG